MKRTSDAAAAKRFQKAVLARGRCEACVILVRARLNPEVGEVEAKSAVLLGRRCCGIAQHAHHITPKGMGGGGDQDPDRNGMACCWRSHEWLHRHTRTAYALGLLRRHGRAA